MIGLFGERGARLGKMRGVCQSPDLSGDINGFSSGILTEYNIKTADCKILLVPVVLPKVSFDGNCNFLLARKQTSTYSCQQVTAISMCRDYG
jgi:hypothetical protein